MAPLWQLGPQQLECVIPSSLDTLAVDTAQLPRHKLPAAITRLPAGSADSRRPAMARVQGANIATELPPCKLPLNKVMSCSLRRCYSTSYNYMLVHLSLVVRPASH